MATKSQRAKSLVDALTNRDMAQGSVLRVVEGCLGLEVSQVQQMTLDQKLDRFFVRIRDQVLRQVKEYERKAAVKAAEDSTEQQVNNDFTEG